jgi:hypothetical protein
MKYNFPTTRAVLFMILLLPLLPSCEEDDIYVLSDTDSKEVYGQFYRSLSDFETGTNKFSGEIVTAFSEHFPAYGWSDSVHFAYYAEPLYGDFRDIKGRSNWGNPKMVLDENCDYSTVPAWDFFIRSYDITIRMDSDLKTPPAHLHLCLHDWKEAPDGVRLGRTWKVSTIVDDQGKDLTGDPDWTYYTDNTMRFEKTDRFVFTPGEKRSAKEIDLFGTASEHRTVIGSYSVTGDIYPEPVTISLNMVFPNFKVTMTVLESRFGYIKLHGESEGKSGILELRPLD